MLFEYPHNCRRVARYDDLMPVLPRSITFSLHGTREIESLEKFFMMIVFSQEKSLEELKSFLARFGTLRVVDSGEGTPDALFGKLNAVVVAMLREVNAIP